MSNDVSDNGVQEIQLPETKDAVGLDNRNDQARDTETTRYPGYGNDLRDDASNAPFNVEALNPVQIEGATGQTRSFDFVVTRYGNTAAALTLNYAVEGVVIPSLVNSAAASASEFVGGAYPTGQVTFAAGATTATISVLVAGNDIVQPDQGFALRVSAGNPTDPNTVRASETALVLDNSTQSVTSLSLGIYRFFDLNDGTHFYSTSQAERNTLLLTRPDLAYEGICMTGVASPATDPAAAPVFRFFDTSNGTHFYSASTAERDGLLATRPDFVFEGTAFYQHLTAQAGDVPVFRFFDSGSGTHFYTSSASERASILASRADLRDEGIAYYTPAV